MRPKASSKLEQTSSGSQISGTVASIKVRNGFEDNVVLVPVALLNEIDCMVTTKSRDISGAIVKDSGFVKAREVSYPPKVSVPRVSFPAAA